MTRDEAAQALSIQRSRIDALDLRILELFNERAMIVQEIGRIKQQVEMPIYEPKREDEVFRNVLGHNRGPLPNDAVKRLFERIIDEMRTVQKRQMERSGSQSQ
ncbi:MAG: chorismate mutase [Bryobacteraceae bacterium]|nr:chorismate mutase [Bryobacteraceae bacterium]